MVDPSAEVNIGRARWLVIVGLSCALAGCAGNVAAPAGSPASSVLEVRSTVQVSNRPDAAASAPGFTPALPTSARPAVLSGPSVSATPIVIIRNISHGGVCAGFAMETQLPSLVVYSDGAALINDGDSCGALTPVRAGWIEPNQLRAQLARYFASADSAVNMEVLLQAGGGEIGIDDGNSTEMTYVDPDGSQRRVSGRELAGGNDVFEQTLRPDILHARNSLRAQLKDITNRSNVQTAAWTPRAAKVVVTGYTPPGRTGRWPLPEGQTPRTVISGEVGACSVLEGTAAMTVLKAQGKKTSASKWLVDGKVRQLAIGFVLPGIPGCQA